jgi:hypothetical protein
MMKNGYDDSVTTTELLEIPFEEIQSMSYWSNVRNQLQQLYSSNIRSNGCVNDTLVETGICLLTCANLSSNVKIVPLTTVQSTIDQENGYLPVVKTSTGNKSTYKSTNFLETYCEQEVLNYSTIQNCFFSSDNTHSQGFQKLYYQTKKSLRLNFRCMEYHLAFLRRHFYELYVLLRPHFCHYFDSAKKVNNFCLIILRQKST